MREPISTFTRSLSIIILLLFMAPVAKLDAVATQMQPIARTDNMVTCGEIEPRPELITTFKTHSGIIIHLYYFTDSDYASIKNTQTRDFIYGDDDCIAAPGNCWESKAKERIVFRSISELN